MQSGADLPALDTAGFTCAQMRDVVDVLRLDEVGLAFKEGVSQQ